MRRLLEGPEGGLHATSLASHYLGTRTFWLSEVTLFDAGLQSLIEHDIELGISRGCQALVVGFDIFFDRLTAVVVDLIS